MTLKLIYLLRKALRPCTADNELDYYTKPVRRWQDYAGYQVVICPGTSDEFEYQGGNLGAGWITWHVASS